MKQASVEKVCAWNERGLQDAPGPARCRLSLHLRASACICGHFRTSEPETLNLKPETLMASATCGRL